MSVTYCYMVLVLPAVPVPDTVDEPYSYQVLVTALVLDMDEKVLANLLQNKQLKGAMLDVFEHEPLSQDNYFRNIENCILTPHIAGVTHESNIRISFFIAHKMLEVL